MAHAHAETPGHGGHDAHGGHGHGGGHGADHVPHVLPLSTYFLTFGALIAFTVITVAVSYVDLGWLNMIVAMLVATCKATIVALLFMHLFFDLRFHAIIFSFSLIFLAVFIIFTMYDTETRGKTDRVQNERPVDIATPFTGNKSDAALKKKLAPEIERLANPNAPGNPAELLSKPPQSN